MSGLRHTALTSLDDRGRGSMRSLAFFLLLGGLVAPSRAMAFQAPEFQEVRANMCDAYAGRIDPGLERARLYRELPNPDSLLVVRSESRMARGQYGMQYVTGHAIVSADANRRGVQASLLLYHRGEARMPAPSRSLRFRLDDSVEVVPARATYRAHQHGSEADSAVTLQIVAPLTPAQFMTIAQARQVEGWLGGESFRLTAQERLGLQAVHAAIMCGVEPAESAAPTGDDVALRQLPPVTLRHALDCIDGAGRPALVATDHHGAVPVSELDEPPRLLSAGVKSVPRGLEGQPGRVELQFVVDTTGLVEPCTLTAEESSDTRLLPAAAAMIRGSRFTPGKEGGRKVRALVKQGITFR